MLKGTDQCKPELDATTQHIRSTTDHLVSAQSHSNVCLLPRSFLLGPLNVGVLSQAVTLTGIYLIDYNGDCSVAAFVAKGRLGATLTNSIGISVATNSTVCACDPVYRHRHSTLPVHSTGIYRNY